MNFPWSLVSERNYVTDKEPKSTISRGRPPSDGRFYTPGSSGRHAGASAFPGQPSRGMNHTVEHDPQAQSYHRMSEVGGEPHGFRGRRV